MDNYNLNEFARNTLVQAPIPEIKYASFLRRLGAQLIDSFITGFIGWLLGVVVGAIWGFSYAQNILASGSFPDPNSTQLQNEFNSGMMDVQFFLTIGMIILFWFYYAGFESSSLQGTPGKRILGIKVTDLYGERITFGIATGRYMAEAISGIILCIGYLMAAFTARKQALHDLIAGTLVVVREPSQ